MLWDGHGRRQALPGYASGFELVIDRFRMRLDGLKQRGPSFRALCGRIREEPFLRIFPMIFRTSEHACPVVLAGIDVEVIENLSGDDVGELGIVDKPHKRGVGGLKGGIAELGQDPGSMDFPNIGIVDRRSRLAQPMGG